MSTRQSHGSAHTELPRSDELAAQLPERDPTLHRDAQGRFTSGNGIGYGRHWKRTIARMLGVDMHGEAGELARETWVLYRALLAELPYDSASVRQLVAARARAAVLAARYARRASEVGLDTKDGAAALAQSVALDLRAERLAVTSLDISSRLAKAGVGRKVIDVHAAVQEAFGHREGGA
jgi:hypothetical protein